MGELLTGRGRVTVSRLTWAWPDKACVMAYTSTGHFGDTAIVGTMPVPGFEDSEPSLWGAAMAHLPTNAGFQTIARWLVCTATAPRLVPSPAALDLRDVQWEFKPMKSFELDAPYSGHERGQLGQLRLLNDVLNEKARSLLG
jgi:hypothetical protein